VETQTGLGKQPRNRDDGGKLSKKEDEGTDEGSQGEDNVEDIEHGEVALMEPPAA